MTNKTDRGDMGQAPDTVIDNGNRATNGAGIDKRFASLETQLASLGQICARMGKKHWHAVEREQYPFWIGIIFVALLGIGGMYSRDVQWVGLSIAIVMLLTLSILVAIYLRTLQGRFGRIWSTLTTDGELFRFTRDAGLVLGYPVEMGKLDEHFPTHLEIDFPDGIKAVETYLKAYTVPDPIPPDAPKGLIVAESTFKHPSGGEAHRVYEVEYRGSVSQAFCIRVSRADSGTELAVGFPVRGTNAESLERLVSSLQIRLQDRLITSKILADIRDIAGVPSIPVPAMANEQLNQGIPVSGMI